MAGGRQGHSSSRYFFVVLVIVVIRHETTAAARWALPLIVRTLFNDAITVAVWTGFHVRLPVDTSASLIRQPNVMHRAALVVAVIVFAALLAL